MFAYYTKLNKTAFANNIHSVACATRLYFKEDDSVTGSSRGTEEDCGDNGVNVEYLFTNTHNRFSIAKWASEYYTNPSYPDEVTKVTNVAHVDTTVPLFFSYV